MNKQLLQVQGVRASLESGKEIIKGLDLQINENEVHVIMGPNGAGKSTLANVIMGHPSYHITAGTLAFQGEDITESPVNERAKKGLFMSFQTPEEVDGITVSDFLKTAKFAVEDKQTSLIAYKRELKEKMQLLSMNDTYASRYLNVGFSGGEKKKNEILQLLMLNPKLAILDETDSGLDVDAVKIVTEGIKHYKNDTNSLLIISHSTRLLENIPVDYVHILVDGKIVHTGDRTLIDKINKDGFADFL